MNQRALRNRVFSLLSGIALLLCSGWASADPPSRVARLGFVAGGVSFSPAGESAWFPVVPNRPLTTDDRLWTDASGRIELEISGSSVRLGSNTSVSIIQLDDRQAQLQLTQGTTQVRVRHLEADQSFVINTPHLALAMHQNGVYRISVSPQDDSTEIVVRQGQGEAFGDSPTYLINAGQAFRFRGAGLRDYHVTDAAPRDEFELWASSRDQAYDNSVSRRYVAPDLVGYQALDAHGVWRDEPGYGYVWVPRLASVNWAPYRYGHWAWINPWGWTWVDDAPWGFAVSHYGRWAQLRGVWCWLPGPLRTRAFYAPALVAFEGGNNFQLAIGSAGLAAVAWFPLGPREIYRPPYTASQDYFQRVNQHNAQIQHEILTHRYNDDRFRPEEHVNRRIPGAVASALANSFIRPNAVRPLVPAPEVRVVAPPKVEPRVRAEPRERAAPQPRAQRPVRPEPLVRQESGPRSPQVDQPQRRLPRAALPAASASANTASAPAASRQGRQKRQDDEHKHERQDGKAVNQH